MELVVIVWLTCGILCAVVASSKNRSWFGWLILGMLTSIFGLIAVAGMPAAEKPTAMTAAERTEHSTFAWYLVLVILAVIALNVGTRYIIG